MKIQYTTYDECLRALYDGADKKYDVFNNKIVNSEYRTVGVRTPKIRAVAKAVPLSARDSVLEAFFADADKTYESVLFAGLVAAKKGDYAATRKYLKRLIPLFGSWAHVDCVIPSLDWVDKDEFLRDFAYLVDCSGQYEVRAYVIFLFDCVTDERIDFVLDRVQSIPTGAYYVDMGLAWLLSECLVKYYDKTLPLLTSRVFPKFVHNKAIQKARESFRVSPERKEELNRLKVKD